VPGRAWQLSKVKPGWYCTHILICSKCRMKMFKVAVRLLTFISARLVSEMPSELASRQGLTLVYFSAQPEPFLT
jgi:hypothetical protein